MVFFDKNFKEIILTAIILVILFIVFGFLCVFLKLKEEITEEDLKIRPMGDNYARIFDEDGNEMIPKGIKGTYTYPGKNYFESEKILTIPERKYFSDSIVFMVPYIAARCESCKKIVPKPAFERHKCPLCGRDPAPLNRTFEQEGN